MRKVEGEDINDIDVYSELLQDEFALELERQPVHSDLNELENSQDLSYEPFHWVVEFPEVAVCSSNGYEVGFDIVIGNPPYGTY